MRRSAWSSLALVALLGACASTQPRASRTPAAEVAVINTPVATATTAPALPTLIPTSSPTTVPPTSVPLATPTLLVETPTAAPTDPTMIASADGPITPSMAQLQIGGERYAALGDPNAPLTIIEYSDFG